MGPGGQSSEEEKCCNDIFTTVSYQTFPPDDGGFQFTNGKGGKNPVLSETGISVSFHSLTSSIFPLEQIIWKYSNTCCIDTGK